MLIAAKTWQVQFVEGAHWVAKASSLTTKYHNIEAVRGNIYASDGSLLATSVPIYEVRMDVNADALTKERFYEGLDSLAYCLSSLFKDKPPLAWKQKLISARNSGDRYFLVQRNVNYNQLKQLKTFPIFRTGRYKGGMIYLQQNKRQRPFQVLAARTIGYDRESIQPVGLEGAYKKELSGVSGKRLMQKIAGGNWMPINDDNEIAPIDGSDLFTTIDINIQDVAENALLLQLQKHDADHGCVVVMEVSTGEIKAIANLSHVGNGRYYESYNYAIGESTEPGSTFKLAALMAAMEDGYVDIYDSVDTEGGSYMFYDKTMYDSKEGGYGKISVKESFALSSNVAISKLINQNYSKKPQDFIDKLHKMNLNMPLGLEISGEGKPEIKNTSEKSWSGVSLPWMSIGYEVKMTPLQILAFYNAVANNGVYVRPRFVSHTSRLGKVEESFQTTIINSKIASPQTIKKAQEVLEAVVEIGTARNLKNPYYRIAGKTGTAQIANDKYGYKYKSKVSHQASFCGYFPAENPKYSCIVVVNAPSRNVFYGNLVAGPIFKEIADKIYATSINIHKELGPENYASITPLPVSKNGNIDDLQTVFQKLNISYVNHAEQSDWVFTKTQVDKVDVVGLKLENGLMPDVVGMNIRDAIYLLENAGVSVEFHGIGVIKNQNPAKGTPLKNIQKVKLDLIS